MFFITLTISILIYLLTPQSPRNYQPHWHPHFLYSNKRYINLTSLSTQEGGGWKKNSVLEGKETNVFVGERGTSGVILCSCHLPRLLSKMPRRHCLRCRGDACLLSSSSLCLRLCGGGVLTSFSFRVDATVNRQCRP